MGGVDLGDDDGFMTVTIGDTTVTIDVWDVQARVVDNHNKNASAPDKVYGDGLQRIIEDLGFGKVSRRMAQMFVEAVNARVAELKAQALPFAGSPGSTTDSTPAA